LQYQDILEKDYEISEELENYDDYEQLSDKAKKFLNYLYHYYFLPLLLNFIIVATAINYDEELREILNKVSTKPEVKSFARKPPMRFERSLLKGYRITTGDKLHFRDAPKMNSNIITVLPIGTLNFY
jgi:hypothetical protein